MRGFRTPVRRSGWVWSERWIDPPDWLRAIEAQLISSGRVVRTGGGFDRWDLDLRDGPLGSARLLLSVEELAGGAQLIRSRCWPIPRRATLLAVLGLGALAATTGLLGAPVAAAIAATIGAVVAALSFVECGSALGALLAAVRAGLGDPTVVDPQTGRPDPERKGTREEVSR
jgi:hypothetical protein